jgi:hypothetical protein
MTISFITPDAPVELPANTTITATLSPITIAYVCDLIVDALMHDGEVRYPVSLAAAPGVFAELDAFTDTLSAAYRASK